MLAFLWFTACVTDPAPPPPVKTIEVVRGDTLGKLAKRNHITVADLMQWNGLSSDRIEVGQVLRIEAGEGASALSPPSKASKRTGRKRTRPRSGIAEGALPDASGPTVPKLSLPAAKPCLSAPRLEDVADEAGMATSQGLSVQGTSASMTRFMPKLGSCLVGLDPYPSTALNLEIHVACNGRVDSVTIQGSNDWPQAHARCITEALRFASFPAHARPDGDSFLYPLRMQ